MHPLLLSLLCGWKFSGERIYYRIIFRVSVFSCLIFVNVGPSKADLIQCSNASGSQFQNRVDICL